MISVIVPTLITDSEQLKVTIQCIEAARKHTALPFHLIIVETESQHLIQYADTYVYEKVKTNATKSINRGFALAESEKVVLLTNDVIVDEGWLEHLLQCFEIPDCGLSTLGADQFHHTKQNAFEEGIWFSVAMIPKVFAHFDEGYINSWDDTDLVMRTYLTGLRMYRNLRSVVHHKIGMTHYSKPDHQKHYEANRARFIAKYQGYRGTPMYQFLSGDMTLP